MNLRGHTKIGGWLAGALLALGSISFPSVGTAAERSAIARGRSIATRSGCLSCHGPDLSGKAMIADPTIAFLSSSNLTRVAPALTDKQLEKTIRTGVRPDGSHLWQMAAAPYAVMTASDMKDLIAFVRSMPLKGQDHGRIIMGPRFIKAVNARKLQPEAIEQARDRVVPPDFGPHAARGRYLARTICAGCHYPSLSGQPDMQEGDPPNLVVAASYDRDQFRTLLRTGKAIGGREVGVMSEEARARFQGLSNDDIDALHEYLRLRAQYMGKPLGSRPD